MQCRNCGTEIADKAIICYRCGTATTDPVRAPAALKRRRSPILSLALAVLLVLLALYMGQASRTAADPGPWQTAAGLLIGAAAVIVLLRLVSRR
jgi:uncharacterized membrane protein YvbJ